MPSYLTNTEIWKALWPLLVMSIVISFVFHLIIRPAEKWLEFHITILAFTMLGIVTGYLTGFSRSPVVGEVIPAALSLIGGLAVFLIGKGTANQILVSVTILTFSISLAIGTSWGADMRQLWEGSREFVKNAYEIQNSESLEKALKRRALVEVRVREFRKNLGLNPDFSFPENGSEDTVEAKPASHEKPSAKEAVNHIHKKE